MRRSWPVDSYGRKYLALRREDLRSDEQALDTAAAWRIIERFVQSPLDSSHLAALAQAAARSAHPSTVVNIQALQKAFTSGQMVLLPRSSQAPRSNALKGSGEGVAEQIKKARELKTWVEFEVLDAEGKPSSNVRYRCMLPDGSLHEGTLDSRGRARYDGIDVGNCFFELVDLENEAWERIA